MYLNIILAALAFLGILCILSGNQGTFLSKEGFKGNAYKIDKWIGRRKCKRCNCSQCAFKEKLKTGSFAQLTNNDLFRKTPKQSPPLDIGRGLRVNKYHSFC